MKRAIFNQLLRRTTFAYTAVSEFSRDCLIRYEKMPSRRIRVIYNGIEVNGNSAGENYRRQIRAELGVGDSDFVVLSIGRLDPIKDFQTLIRAFRIVLDRLPNSYLWIAGDGDQNYKNELSRLIQKLGLSTKARLLGNRSDVNSLLAGSDLFALCSITEATSMTILEAMAAGRAVVATDTGGNPEIVVNEKTGLLAPVGDAASVANAIIRLLEDSGLRNSFGRAGRAKTEQQFFMPGILREYEKLYEAAALGS